MKIKTALILCAGYGKRLNPITLTTPKPLLKINEITLLENCIKLIQFSNKVISFIFSRGFGVVSVIGFKRLPYPAHKINAVLIFISYCF